MSINEAMRQERVINSYYKLENGMENIANALGIPNATQNEIETRARLLRNVQKEAIELTDHFLYRGSSIYLEETDKEKIKALRNALMKAARI